MLLEDDTYEDDHEGYGSAGSSYFLLSTFPKLIRETRGIVPSELTEKMKKILVFFVRRNNIHALGAWEPGLRFLTNPKNLIQT